MHEYNLLLSEKIIASSVNDQLVNRVTSIQQITLIIESVYEVREVLPSGDSRLGSYLFQLLDVEQGFRYCIGVSLQDFYEPFALCFEIGMKCHELGTNLFN